MTGAPHRIVLVMQAPPASEAAFEPVLRIARRTEACIEGVFVEDQRMFAVAALPTARFVHARSHGAFAPDERALRRAIRVTSSRTRQAFTARVTATSVPWSFSSRQCASLSEAFSGATSGDLVVVTLLRDGSNIGQVSDLVGAVTQHIPASLLVLSEHGTPGASILVLFDGDLDDLGAALALADHFDCRVSVLAVAEDENTADARATQARSHLAALNRSAGVAALAYRDASDLDRAIRAAAPATLVIDRAGRTAKTLDIAGLLATSDISLYLRN